MPDKDKDGSRPEKDHDINKNIRSAKEIKQSLLKKAIAEGRGHEMIKLILWRLAEIRHFASQDEDAIQEARFMKDQPKSIRALNTLAFHKDSDIRFSQRDEEVADGFVHQTPELVN